jgi:hypothetical protein
LAARLRAPPDEDPEPVEVLAGAVGVAVEELVVGAGAAVEADELVLFDPPHPAKASVPSRSASSHALTHLPLAWFAIESLTSCPPFVGCSPP